MGDQGEYRRRKAGRGLLMYIGLAVAPAAWGADSLATAAIPVVVAEVAMMEPQANIHLTGTVAPRRFSLLSSEVDGLVAEVLVEEGDFVRGGQPLLRLRAKRKELELAAQRARLKSAQAAADLAGLKESRQAELLRSQVTAQDTHDIAAAELRQALAEVAYGEAVLASLGDELQRHQLLAPFAGVIGEKRTEVGAWLRAGEGAFTLEEVGVVRVEFALPQRYFDAVGQGTPVQLGFDAWPGEQFPRLVSRKIVVGSSSARAFPVWVDLDNPDHRIAPGMSARVSLDVGGDHQPVKVIPADAVVKRPDGSEQVWKLDAKSGVTVLPAPIRTGRAFDYRVEVLEGELAAGDRVVVRGNENLRPGQEVRVVQ